MKISEIKKEILKKNPNVEKQIKMDLPFQVGRMIMNARLMQGMTQEALAKKVGTKQPAIARIESGSNLPNLSFLDKIAKKAFGSYLIPPRFAFMKQEEAFTVNLSDREPLESGTLISNYPQPVKSYYYMPKEIQTNTHTYSLTPQLIFS
jgi:transcriptional regulator with XRE-family HTH domain